MNITKLSALALTALVAGAAVASPAFAIGDKRFDGDYLLTQLQYDGVNAIAADQVTDDTFRATVVLPDGHTTFEFFNTDTLQQIKR